MANAHVSADVTAARILRVDDGLNFIVHDQDERPADATEDVGEGTLEEGAETFLRVNLREGVERAVVQLLAGARVHHQTTTDSVERIGEDARSVRRNLCDDELEDKGRILGEERTLTGIVETKVRTAVDDDTLDGDAKALVESHRARALGNLGQTINQAGEFTRLVATDIGGETSTRKVKRVDNQQGTGASQTARRHVDGEKRPKVILRAVGREQPLNRILERKVEGLRREITNNVRRVTSPEGGETLFGGHARKAVNNASVSRHFPRHDLWVRVLGLNQKLDAFNRRRRRLGNGTGDTTLRESKRIARPNPRGSDQAKRESSVISSIVFERVPVDLDGSRSTIQKWST